MKRLLTLLALLPLAVATPGPSTIRAQDAFPHGPITIVVPYTPGGTTDLLARRVAQGMSERLRQPVVVENRPGAGTAVAAAHVARAPADGHTLLVASNATLAVNPHFRLSVGYGDNSFDTVSLLAAVPNVIVVPAESPHRDLAGYLAHSKEAPVSYGSMGAGTSNHIGMEILARFTGAKLLHVPYRGSAPALADLLGGHVDAIVDTLVATLPHLNAGKLRALAILSAKRSPASAVPTATEIVGKEIDLYSWFGLVVPKGTPAAVVQALNESAVAALKAPATRAELERLGVELIGSSPGEFAAFVDRQRTLYGDIIRSLDLKLN